MNKHMRALATVLMSLAAGVCAAAAKSDVNEGIDLDVHVRDEASASDAGLPTYPRARPYKEDNESSSGANVGFSLPGFGLKVVAMKLESRDSPARVGAFYRQALATYGTVLDCSDVRESKRRTRARDEDDLVCDADDPGENSLVYKVGTESNQRVVTIKPHGSGTRFSLVHVHKREKR
jgi:hypothetical protein